MTNQIPILILYTAKSLWILDEISSRWTEAGDLLGLSPAHLDGIEEHRLRDARLCCRDVLQDWIQDNQGSYPVSWEGLICLLKDMKLIVLAKEVQSEFVQHLPSLLFTP